MQTSEIQTEKRSRSPHKVISDNQELPPLLRQLAGLNRAGTSKLFTPTELYFKALDYFKFVKETPIISKQLITAGQKAGEVVEIEKPRLPTLKEMCLHLGVNSNYLNHLTDQVEGKEDEINKQYSIILTCIKDTIETNWFQNAAVREYDSVFISKLAGLADKSESKIDVTNTVTSITFVRQAVEDADYTEVNEMLDTE
jgi:hypothetical protein